MCLATHPRFILFHFPFVPFKIARGEHVSRIDKHLAGGAIAHQHDVHSRLGTLDALPLNVKSSQLGSVRIGLDSRHRLYGRLSAEEHNSWHEKCVGGNPLHRAGDYNSIEPVVACCCLASWAIQEMAWNDFEDAVQSATAERIQADFIITRNVRDFRQSKVLAFTPSEFLARI